jgi:hypothetical protein
MAYSEPYPVATMLRARELRESGWPPKRVRELLDAEGLGAPSVATIYLWTNPEYHERHREATRTYKRRQAALGAAFRLRSDSPEYAQAFMEALRAERVSCGGIAKVCRVVLGMHLSESQVRYRLGEEQEYRRRSEERKGAAA